MKKVMLYLSLAMSVIYVVAVALMIVMQDVVRKASGWNVEETIFLLPVTDIAICIVTLVITAAFSILLLKRGQDVQANIETAVIILFSIFIVFLPWIGNLLFIPQYNYYVYSMGSDGVAAYSVLHSSITGCGPFLVFAMLLLIIHAGISLGRRGR